MIDLALALAAGVLTVTAPCILPMLPVLLGASIGQTSRTRPLCIALGFTLSFSAVALVLGALASSLGLSADALRGAAIAGLLVFGALMVWPRPFEWLGARLGTTMRSLGRASDAAGTGDLGGFVLGSTLGVVWTPCAGPVLGSILTQVATSEHASRSVALMICYACGAGLPMLAIAYGGQLVSTRVRAFLPYAHRTQQAFGVVVILSAVAMHYRYDSLITVWLSDFYPTFGWREA